MYPPIKYNNTQARVAPLRTAGADKPRLSEDIRADAMRLGSKTNTPEVAASQQLKDCNGQIRLCNVGGVIKEVFKISGFDSLFPVNQTYAEAVKFS